MSLSEAIDHIRPSIVQIIGPSREVLGTGFFVNSDGYVVTARHVIQNGHQRAEKIIIGLAMPNLESMIGGVDLSFTANFIIVDCDIIDEDERHDIALLKLKKNPFRGEVRSHLKLTPESEEMSPLFGIPRFNPKRPKDGTSIAISGYPLGENVLITNAGYIASSWSTDVQKIRPPGAPSGFLIPDITDIYLADVEINPGNSGGPVYTIQNLPMVIGMCVASKPRLVTIRDDKGKPAKIVGKYLLYSSGLTVVIPIRFVIDLIQKNDVNWSEN